MAFPMCRVVASKKPTVNPINQPATVAPLPVASTFLPTTRGSAPAVPNERARSQGSRAAPLSATSQEAPTASPQATMPDTDLELSAQRVRQLEAEAIAMHDLAQRLNKEGRFKEAQTAYASMHRLEDEASELAARVGCVACVLGEPSQGRGQEQPALCTLDPAVLVPYQQLHAVLPWLPADGRSTGSQGRASETQQQQQQLQQGEQEEEKEQTMQQSQQGLQFRRQQQQQQPGSGSGLWISELGARALSCVMGSALADAAAMGVHWVYDLTVLDEIERERRQQAMALSSVAALFASTSASTSTSASAASSSSSHPEHPFAFGLEFMEPPRSPFYSYTSGRNSPYGEQTLVLLRSLAEGAGGGGGSATIAATAVATSAATAAAPETTAAGLLCGHYAALFAQTFRPESSFDGYRDVSTKGFLRNYGRGMPPPLSGANDAQANCVARLAPLVAAFAAATAAAPPTVSSRSAAAQIQNRATSSATDVPEADAATAASAGTAAADAAAVEVDTLSRCVELATRVTQNTDAAVAWACTAAAVLERLLLRSTAEAAVRDVVRDLDSPQGRLAPFVKDMGPEIADHLTRVLELRTTPVPTAVAALGRNCHMPNALQTPLHVVLHVEFLVRSRRAIAATAFAAAMTGVTNGDFATIDDDGAHGDAVESQGAGSSDSDDPWVAALPAEAYVWGVRLAVREGGCCASRAAYVGACLGAMVAGLGPGGAPVLGLPEDWLLRYPAAGQVQAWAEALVEARRRAGEMRMRRL